uniref:Pleckstrin homology domain containing A4 n=1 Tax=Myotis lucifugus TaxID=59463 RepID=G1Q8D8_MYOLU
MEEGRPRSSLSLASSASTISSLSSLSTKKIPTSAHGPRSFNRTVHARPHVDPLLILSSLSPQDSSGLRLWKRRWFVLSGHCLFYYKDSREESVLGSVLLPSYSVRPDGPGAPRGRRFTFTAEHPGMRTYVLAADTLEDLRGWIRALGRASRAEGDDGPLKTTSVRPAPSTDPRPGGGPPHNFRRLTPRLVVKSLVFFFLEGQGRHHKGRHVFEADLLLLARDSSLFTPLSRPPSPLSLPRPRSAPARRPPPSSSGDTPLPARPHTPLSRIDVRPPSEWGPQRQALSRPPTPRRGPASEAGGGRPPRSPQPWHQEARTQYSSQVPSGSSTYIQLPPRSPGTRASMVLLRGPPPDSSFNQSLGTDVIPPGTQPLLRSRVGRRYSRRSSFSLSAQEQLEAALELTRQQLGQAAREAAAPPRAWGRQRLLQDRLVSVRATLCHLTQERERVWDTYSGLEQELGTLRETLEYLLHLGSPQDRTSAQQQLWMMEDTLAGLGGPQKPPQSTEPDSPSPALQGEESSERESLPESLELSSPRSPEADWGRPPGGDRGPASPRSGVGSPRISQASSREGRCPPSPQPGAKPPQARPRMSAQEQLERLRRNQECGRPLPRPASPRLLTLGRTLSPARCQPDAEQK